MCNVYPSSEILRLDDLIRTGHFLQKHVISLDGPVVTATGCKDQLAVVTHVSDCLPSNEQVGTALFFLFYFPYGLTLESLDIHLKSK